MTYITIDGPAGSGKSSVAFFLAKELGFEHLDTGALYRSAALLWLREEEDLFLNALKKASFELENGKLKLNGKTLGDEIRTPEIGKVVSKVAEMPSVREIITQKTRELADKKNVVVEGRDIGTVVLPNACVKIFLVASVQERAKRRYAQYLSKGIKLSFEDVVKEIESRDRIDSSREVAPLKPAEDAVIFNTDSLTLNEVVEKLKEIVMEKLKKC
jgi:cytidylate kinase